MTSLGRAGRLTAIQLWVDGELTARLLCGGPYSIVSGHEGEIALLPAGRVAAYLVARRRTTGLYVFRTAGGEGRTVVPGVSDRVCLLLSSSRRGTAKRIRNFIRKVTSYGHDPSQLTDEFWTRAAGALLARRRPSTQLLSSLLAREATSQGDASCGEGSRTAQNLAQAGRRCQAVGQ
jgi:hypothetical protein